MNKYVEEVKMLTLPDFNSDEDSIGHITVEGFKDVPFEIKRIFYIFGKENVGLVRGRHANRKSEFVLFNIYYNNSDYLKKAQKYGQITG